MIYIGIDPGRNTGLAAWDPELETFVCIKTTTCVGAMALCLTFGDDIHITFEDARQRKWFGNKGREALQGAGAIKRECTIWEEFCKHHKIPCEMVPPQAGATKMNAELFKRVSGWEGRTSEHARDAGLLVINKK